MKLPRYHELVTKQEEKKVCAALIAASLAVTLTCTHSSFPSPFQAVPGPGKYDIRSQFAHRQQQKDASEPPLAPFGSTTKVCSSCV